MLTPKITENAFYPPKHQYGHYWHVCTCTRNLINAVIITVSHSASHTQTWQSRRCHSSGGIPPNHYGCTKGHRHSNKVANIKCVMRARKKNNKRRFNYFTTYVKKKKPHCVFHFHTHMKTHKGKFFLTTVTRYRVKYETCVTCARPWPLASLLLPWVITVSLRSFIF